MRRFPSSFVVILACYFNFVPIIRITGAGAVPSLSSLLVPLGSQPNLNCTCGRIYNFTEAGKGLMPWLTAIVYRDDPEFNAVCWGSLINDRYVLSAAHCTSRLRAESTSILLRNSSDTALLIDIASIKNHARFSIGNNYSYDNDISLIKLRVPVNFQDFPTISPVCLPPELPQIRNLNKIVVGTNTNEIDLDQDEEQQLDQIKAYLNRSRGCDFPVYSMKNRRFVTGIRKKVTNYGEDETEDENEREKYTFKLLPLRGLERSFCSKVYPERVKSQFFCAQDMSRTQDTSRDRYGCNHIDSGTPALYARRIKEECDLDYTNIPLGEEIKSIRFVQTGISTMQIRNCITSRRGHPILLFVDVLRYRKWIRENTQDARYCQNSP